MTFKVYKSSDRGFNDGTPTEINTLEELIQFMDKQKNPIIIDREFKKQISQSKSIMTTGSER